MCYTLFRNTRNAKAGRNEIWTFLRSSTGRWRIWKRIWRTTARRRTFRPSPPIRRIISGGCSITLRGCRCPNTSASAGCRWRDASAVGEREGSRPRAALRLRQRRQLYARVWSAMHGCTPSEARKPGAQLTLFPSLVFQIQIKGVEAMHWRMEERDAFEVFGIERRIGCEDNGAVPAFWTECHQDGSYERIFEAANAKPSAESRVRFAPSAATKRRTAGRSLICSAR